MRTIKRFYFTDLDESSTLKINNGKIIHTDCYFKPINNILKKRICVIYVEIKGEKND